MVSTTGVAPRQFYFTLVAAASDAIRLDRNDDCAREVHANKATHDHDDATYGKHGAQVLALVLSFKLDYKGRKVEWQARDAK